MPNAREILLADADVLIDYAAADLSISKIVSEHIGKVHVLKQTLPTVENLTEKACAAHDMVVIEADTGVLTEAGALTGPLSFEDWLCLIVCRERSWTCVTNDRALRHECRKDGLRVRRGSRVDGRLGFEAALSMRNGLDELREPFTSRIQTTSIKRSYLATIRRPWLSWNWSSLRSDEQKEALDATCISSRELRSA